MSHTDDPTVEKPIEGESAQAGNAGLPDITQKQFLETIKLATGKSEDELLSMDNSTLDNLIAQSFENKGGGSQKETPSATETPESGKPAEKPKETPADDETEVTVSIKPSLLKPFATGKELSEAVVEAVRRAKEGEDAVELYTTKTIPNLQGEINRREERIAAVVSENSTLKRDLEELRAKKKDEPQQIPVAGDDETLPEIPTLPEEIDPFDEENRKAFVDALSVMRKRDEILSRKLLKKTEAPAPAREREVSPQQPAPENDVKKAAAEEFAAARIIQNNRAFPDVFRASRDITEINQDYVNFGVNLAKLYGIQQPIDQNGFFTPETTRVITEYYGSSAEGEKIRSAAKANRILPPADDDLMVLRRVNAARAVQRSRFMRDGQGNTVPIPAEEAVAIAARENPHLFTVKNPVDTRRQELEAMERATANRAKHTQEVPAAIGADINDLSKIPVENILKIVAKPQDKWTAEEAELVKKTARANGMNDEEIAFFLDNLKPKQ